MSFDPASFDPASFDPASSLSLPVSVYEDQVVAFFRQRDVAEQIVQRYQRGVRPQFQAVIDAIRTSGTPALERIQMSGSIATYELALVMRCVRAACVHVWVCVCESCMHGWVISR